MTDTFSLTNANNAGSAVADVLLRNFAQGRCISQSPQEYPASAIDVPGLTRTPSEPTTTRRPPRFGMVSPDQEHVLLVYASFTSNNSLPL